MREQKKLARCVGKLLPSQMF